VPAVQQVEAGQRAHEELQRLQRETVAKAEEVVGLHASIGQQAAAMLDLQRQRDEEAARRCRQTTALLSACGTSNFFRRHRCTGVKAPVRRRNLLHE